jgi:hypothetical protein
MSAEVTNLFFQIPWWGYVLITLFLLFAVIHHFAPEILKQIYEQLAGIAIILSGFLSTIGKLFSQLGQSLWAIWGLGFALRWRFQFAIRYLFARTTLGVLALSTLYLLAELGVALVRGFKRELPEMYTHLIAPLSSHYPAVHAWLNNIQMPHIHEIPFKLDIVLFILAWLMFRHHRQEFFASMRREAVPPALEEVFLEFDKFRDNPTPDSTTKENFLEILMRKLKDVLDDKAKHKTKRDVAFALFEEEKVTDAKGTTTKTGNLAISFLPDKSPLDKGLKIPIGKGGAGKAFEAKVAIYIPSVRHRIGIDLDNKKSVGLIYFAHKNPQHRARSILSVPVLVNSKKDVIAVVAVSSEQRKTFRDADFEIVRLAASIVSTLY